MTPIYKKVGRRYVEIGTYDNEQIHYPHGAHLVWSRPGGVLTRYNIEPADAALLAAMERVREAMTDAMHAANVWKPDQLRAPMTEAQRKAWRAYQRACGDDRPFMLTGPCLQDIVEAGINAAREVIK